VSTGQCSGDEDELDGGDKQSGGFGFENDSLSSLYECIVDL
jgi:hypothetical protein